MDATKAKLLAFPRHGASQKTTLRRDQIISVYTPLAMSMARSFAAGRRVEEAEVIGIVMLELTQQSARFDVLIRKRVEGAMRDSVDPNRRKGRAAKESTFTRELPDVPDEAPSVETELIEREETGYMRQAVAKLPDCDRKVLEMSFRGSPIRGRPVNAARAVAKVREIMRVAQAA